MARIRSFKPELFTDEAVDRVGDTAFRLYLAMWSEADDATGCFDARPAIAKARAFALRDAMPLRQVQALLEALAAEGLITLYGDAQGRQLGQITGWRHQKIDRPSKVVRFQTPADPGCIRRIFGDDSNPTAATALVRESTIRRALDEPSTSPRECSSSPRRALDEFENLPYNDQNPRRALDAHSRALDAELGAGSWEQGSEHNTTQAEAARSPASAVGSCDSEEGDKSFPDGPASSVIAQEESKALDEQALAVVQSFREDYVDNVDAEYKFKPHIPASEIRAAKAYLQSKDWPYPRMQNLKQHVMLDQRPGQKFPGFALQTRCFAKLWHNRDDLEARCVRGK